MLMCTTPQRVNTTFLSEFSSKHALCGCLRPTSRIEDGEEEERRRVCATNDENVRMKTKL